MRVVRRLTPTVTWASVGLGAALCLAGSGAWAQAAKAGATAPAPKGVKTVRVALVSMQSDDRYGNRRLERAYPGHPGGRLLHAVELGVADTEVGLAEDKLALQVQDVRLNSPDDLAPTLQRLRAEGVVHWLLDVPAPVVTAAAQVAGQTALLFNVSASHDALRGAQCAAQLLHTMPSQAMLADALGQYLAARSWRQALVLQGPGDANVLLADAWARAAKRYGIQSNIKPYKLSGDPRERDLSNPRLLTADRQHDVVVVWDADGEFARTVPYATQQPRPVVGSNGLAALAWHPQWERHGGPQVTRRFRKAADRPMTGQDWAAWMAVRSVAAVVQAQPQASVVEQARLLRSGQVTVDGAKGAALSYRAWDGQLRQPVFLAHADGVVATAPMDGVLHPTEVLDTLGHDLAESTCRHKP